MTHPLIPSILALAAPVAQDLGLEVVGAVFHTNQTPPVLRVDISHPGQDISLEECELMSRALEAALDAVDLVPDAYVLEVSSPGLSNQLSTDRDFLSFKGFPVTVMLTEPHGGKQVWAGNLMRRDDEAVYLNQKGRAIALPRHQIAQVQLADSE